MVTGLRDGKMQIFPLRGLNLLTYQPTEEILHDRLLQCASFVGDEDLLDPQPFAKIDGSNAIPFNPVET